MGLPLGGVPPPPPLPLSLPLAARAACDEAETRRGWVRMAGYREIVVNIAR